MEYYEELVYVEQYQDEAMFEYLERYTHMLENLPNGLSRDAQLNIFLDGMLATERYILDEMAGGSIFNCCLNEIWDIIEERAAQSRPYIEYTPQQPLEEALGQLEIALQGQERISNALADLANQVSWIVKDFEYIRDQGMFTPSIEEVHDLKEDIMEEESRVLRHVMRKSTLNRKGLPNA